MKRNRRALALALGVLLVGSCTLQSRFVALEDPYSPLPNAYPIEIILSGVPTRPYKRIARLDVHLERTHFLTSDLDDALPELKEQARRSGSHAVIEIEERRSSILETTVYHVTAIGIRYTDQQ